MHKFLALLCCVSYFQIYGSGIEEELLAKFPNPTYQDILIRNQLIRQGINICSPRYDLIKPILNQFQGPFTVLDLGAAQGYFSFRIAQDFPQARCIMLEENNSHYKNHGDILHHLCLLNQLDNIVFLRKKADIQDLYYLNNYEHFDVVLAFLVVHQMEQSLDRQMVVIESLLRLGDIVIIETANDVAVPLTDFVDSLSKNLNCQYLGEMRRTHDPLAYGGSFPNGTGKFYCFQGISAEFSPTRPRQGISEQTFIQLNGVYP